MTIELKRKAGELREKAQVKLDELKVRVEAQIDGTVADGETKLSHEEIKTARQEIETMFEEAKEVEGLNELEDILSRPDTELGNRAVALKELFAAIPSGGTEVLEDEEVQKRIFGSTGEFVRALRASVGQYDGHVLTDAQDIKLRELMHGANEYGKGEEFNEKSLSVSAETGKFEEGAVEALKEALDRKALTGASGGGAEALVPTVHMAELLRAMGETQQFAQRARHIPMPRRTMDFPRLIQTAVGDTRPMYGFAAVTKIAEGVQKPEHEPEFDQLTLNAVKYAAYVEASDELLAENIVSTGPILVDLLTQAIAYEFDRDCMRGSGTGEPQGFIGSAAEFEASRANADQIQIPDIFEMEARFFGTNGVYMYHPSTIPELYALAASNVIVWNPDLSTGVPGTLIGRPLVSTHKLPVLGTKGDLCLVDPSFYLVGDLQRITIGSSIHFRFRNDLTAWRAVFRAAGTPWPASTFSHESTGAAKVYEVSPFVVLGTALAS